jgi:hypothetical protein
MDWQTIFDMASKISDKSHELDAEYFDVWKTAIVFSWRWWVAAGIMILPWILWAVIKKCQSIHRLLYAGAVIALLSTFLDLLGIILGFWFYPVTVFPFTPSYIPFDLCALPVATMIWLQSFPKMNLIMKTLIYAGGGALFDLICDTIGLTYQLDSWSRAYTYIILSLMYLLAYWVSKRKKFDPV